ncbi:MAG: TonB-dependent receptor [Bacteroidaceae bacterium]|nr:TonB-dependent receptor [Bacteroidaceae bacterium]
MKRGFICAVVSALFSSIPGSISAGTVHEAGTFDLKHADMEETTDATPDDDGFTVGLGEIEIIGSRVPLAEVQAPRMVTLMTQEDIQAASVHSINDLLEYAVGVDVRQRGEMGVQTDISMRGGNFDQITLLLNGVNISSPHTGHLTADFPVSVYDIERIEVIEGPSARVFGTSAFTGVINIVTRKAETDGGLVHLSGGQFGTVGADISMDIAGDNNPGRKRFSLSLDEDGLRIGRDRNTFSNRFSAGMNRSDGATPNSDFTSWRGFWNSSIRQNGMKIDMQAGYSYRKFGANTFYGAASTDQWESNERIMAAVTSEFRVGQVHVAPSVSWNRWFDHYQWHKGSPAGENYHQVDTWAASVNSWVDSRIGRTSFGIEMRTDMIRSTKLGYPLDTRQYYSLGGIDAVDSLDYRFAADRTDVSAFLEHNILLDDLTISFGLLANMNTALDYGWRLYPGIDLSYRPFSGTTLFASWNKALRMPTFTDLFYSGTNIQGTTNLKPEKTSDFNLGLRYRTGGVNLQLQGFYSRRTDMIDWVIYADEPDGKTFRSGNFSVDCSGVEFSGAIYPGEYVSSLSFLRRLSVQYAHIHQDQKYDTPIKASKYAMEYLRHKVVLQADAAVTSRLGLSASWRWQDRTGQDNEPYSLLDGRITWTETRWNAYISCSNILNEKYRDYSFIEQPGRWLMVGVILNLSFQ